MSGKNGCSIDQTLMAMPNMLFPYDASRNTDNKQKETHPDRVNGQTDRQRERNR